MFATRCAAASVSGIEEPEVIATIPGHLGRMALQRRQPELPFGARAPPVQSRLL